VYSPVSAHIIDGGTAALLGTVIYINDLIQNAPNVSTLVKRFNKKYEIKNPMNLFNHKIPIPK
jgi:hypothetical protein